MKKGFIFCVLIFLVWLTACSRDEGTAETATMTPEMTTTAVSVTTTPIATPTASPTPEPTTVPAAISVSEQALGTNGQIVIDTVSVPEAGWLVIHAQSEGQVGEVLGQTAVSPGINHDVTITIDPLQATDPLIAMLHHDNGTPGTFEFPGPDSPWQEDGTTVMTDFAITYDFRLPTVTIADQNVGEDGIVQVETVVSVGDGWLQIHADENGRVGEVLGSVFVPDGVTESLPVAIRWREATPTLHAVLYEDNGRSRRFDPTEDLPVLVGGVPLITTFNVTLPLDVFVLDQPVIDGKIELERVYSNGPGWAVVYFDNEGDLGLIIGFAPLAAGLNEAVEIEVIESAVTPQLHILLHTDDEPIGEFDFPQADRPVTTPDGRLPAPVTFRTDPGNYLITRDQPLTADTVLIPYVVTDLDTWLVIYTDSDGQPGEIVGRIPLPPGINRNIQVPVSGVSSGDTLWAVLHLDATPTNEFNFPDGNDTPLLRNGNIIQSPFMLVDTP